MGKNSSENNVRQNDLASSRGLGIALVAVLAVWGSVMAVQAYRVSGDIKRAVVISGITLGFTFLFFVLSVLKRRS